MLYEVITLSSFILILIISFFRMEVITWFEGINNRPALRQPDPVLKNDQLRIFVMSFFISAAFLGISLLLRIADFS